MTTYYISGPMRGKPDFNFAQFDEVELALARYLIEKNGIGSGDLLINPAKNFDGDTTRKPSEYLTLDLKHVLESDVLVLLPGWRESEGARREVEVAIWTGKKFMEAIEANEYYTRAGYDYPNPPLSGWVFEDVDITAPSENEPSVRQVTLETAQALVTGDRNNSYGPPTQDFQRTADALTAYGYRHTQLPASAPACPTCGARPLKAHDVAVTVGCVKISRIMWSPKKPDHWVDLAGYSACGAECAAEGQ